MRPPTVEWKTVSNFYWLKPPPLLRWCQVLVHVWTVPAALAYSWPGNGPLPCAASSVAFFKEVVSSSVVTPSLVDLHRHVWWVVVSRKRTSTERAQRKLSCPAWSGVSPWTCQAWVQVALPHSSKDNWYIQALPRRERGDTEVDEIQRGDRTERQRVSEALVIGFCFNVWVRNPKNIPPL